MTAGTSGVAGIDVLSKYRFGESKDESTYGPRHQEGNLQIVEGLDLRNCQRRQKVLAAQGVVQVDIVKPGG